MTDYVAPIFAQAGIQLRADGGYIGDRHVFPTYGGGSDDGEDLTQIILATDIQKTIAQAAALLAEYGFIRICKIVCRARWISIGYYSAISNAYHAHINIYVSNISVCVGHNDCYYSTLWRFERFDKEYCTQLAAAKNHRA